ncbi:blastula protease 10-like [Uloborus diversus]|uniref:blastula protease 10-like n=1 Tax=Uloborus diversus TaxID=327109 RepID=UPI002409462D|nr:blastula protease 10-like [Uloborus diversus]
MVILRFATLLLLGTYGSFGFSYEDMEEDDTSRLTDSQILTELNPTETEEGNPIVQGDIVLPPGSKREDFKGIVNVVTLWTNGKISYNYHSSVDEDLKTMIRGAMDEWEKHSCLKFTEKVFDFNYLRYRSDKEGCWSMIGRINSPFAPQDVSIGQGCNRTNIIVHEIGHAIGFYHEQSRNDRDEYIKILWHNMPVARYSQFDKGLESPRGVEYDYTSVMHYGPMAFTSKYFQKNTIAARNPHRQTLIGSGMKISFRDAKLINKMYSCSVHCPNNNESQCLNGGFLSPYRGDQQPCDCVCPPGATGEFCENVSEPFEYYELPPCGGNVTEDAEISTPGYPQRSPPKDSCSWWIQAPEGKQVQVEFMDFSFAPRVQNNASRWHEKCYDERVEIRTRNRYDGDMFCGEDIPPGTVATSAEREFIIIIDTKESAQTGRGMRAKVTMVDDETPEESAEYKDTLRRYSLP